MNTVTFYHGADAFLAFDVFMVVAFTVVQLGLARALPHAFIRTLATVWMVHVVRVVERSVYFTLQDYTGWQAAVLIGVFGATCALPVPLVRHAVTLDRSTFDRDDVPAWPSNLWLWGLGGFVVGALTHVATARLASDVFEASAAIWSRLFAIAPLVPLLIYTRAGAMRVPAVRPLFWGFALQLLVLVVDAALRVRSFGSGASMTETLLVASLTAASTLFLGVASLLSAVEYERDAMVVRGARFRQAQSRVIESERWQQIGQLARGVAHDFNNILGVIVSGNDLVDDALRHRDPAIASDLAEMEYAVARGRGLTQRLLRFSGQIPAVPEAVDISRISRDLHPMLKRLATPDRQLVLDTSAEQRVEIDPAAYEQILLNLIINARDATPYGGHIAVRVADTVVSEPRPSAIGTLRAGPYVRLTVTDNGTGMTEHTLTHLWEPFFSTKGERGSGIGLPTVAMATVEVGGAIVVDSTEGRGSQFQVWLPAVAPRA